LPPVCAPPVPGAPPLVELLVGAGVLEQETIDAAKAVTVNASKVFFMGEPPGNHRRNHAVAA
jgi:hypothetical protein